VDANSNVRKCAAAGTGLRRRPCGKKQDYLLRDESQAVVYVNRGTASPIQLSGKMDAIIAIADWERRDLMFGGKSCTDTKTGLKRRSSPQFELPLRG
jgi:hypothetical protein